jgi:hypothetical protein
MVVFENTRNVRTPSLDIALVYRAAIHIVVDHPVAVQHGQRGRRQVSIDAGHRLGRCHWCVPKTEFES